MSKFEEKTIHSKQVYTGKIISLQVDEVCLPDGNQSKRELVKHPGAVAVIPITEDGKIILVEQYRKALEKTIIEIPAGQLEKGEEPAMTAVRELEEETGYTTTLDQLEFVDSFYTSPGFADEIIHIYLATTIEKLSYNVPGDEDEFIEIIEVTLEEAQDLMKRERIHDAKTNYAIQYLKWRGI